MDQTLQDTTPVWLAGMPLETRLTELTGAGLSEADGLLQLLEWAIRCRPPEEIQLLRTVLEPHQQDMATDVAADLRWLLAFAALRAGHYMQALTLLAPLSHFDTMVDRPLGPHERGPQVLASVLVAQVLREVGVHTSASDEAGRALAWLGDVGATDFASCWATVGPMWKGAHLLGCELEAGLAEDALACRDLDGARVHAVAARRWLPRHALDSGPQDSGPRDSGPRDSGPRDSGPQETVPWRYHLMLLLLWSKLALAHGRCTAALRNAEFALRIAQYHQALPDLARCWYQHGLALLGAPFDPTQYLLEPDRREPVHREFLFGSSLGRAAEKAENAGMPGLAITAHHTLGALYAPHDRKMTVLHIDHAMQLAECVGKEVPPDLIPWWELSRVAMLRLAHLVVHDKQSSCHLWPSNATAPDATTEPSSQDRDENKETPTMQGIDDFLPPPELETELRAALQQVGYMLADEAGIGAVITPAAEEDGLVVGWQPSPALSPVQTTVSAELVMKELAQILEIMGFLARRYEPDPRRLIVKGVYSPLLDADEEDGGDRTARWYNSEAQARQVQLGWLTDTRVYNAEEMRNGLTGHPLRDLVVQVLIALDTAGLPLQVDWPDDGLCIGINVTVFPQAANSSYVRVSWEPEGPHSEYQREAFRTATRTLIERVLNTHGIVTGGNVTDGSVYVFAQPTSDHLPCPGQPTPR